MAYAGALAFKEVTDNTTYLNNKTKFWTISPASVVNEILWDPKNLRFYSVGVCNIAASARPVINLKSNVTVLSGSGTREDPWVLSQK